jgi:uncharacterized iron-regulated membrane protein
MNTTATIRSQTYNAVWRWHFYAALFVVPFLILLPVTGVLMLLQQPIEAVTQASLRQVPASGSSQPAEQQLDAVRRQFPGAQVREYIPPTAVDASSEFAIELPSHGAEAGNHGGHGAPAISVFVDPYTTRVLGTFDPSASLYAWAKSLHGSLALGPVGEILIEVAAGLAVLMVLTGAFLAWPRSRGELTQLIPRRPLKRRAGWRAVHGLLGLTLVLPLLFFLLSGLTWTSVWGGKLVQAWSALPGQNFEAPQADALHEDLNRAGPNRVPWVLEPTPLPASGSMSGHPPVSSLPVDLDAVVVLADKLGFERFRVHLPRGEDGVWTIAATTIAGDITNPGAERTVHIDRYSGRVLADLRFADYPLMGKAMSASIPLHQGDLGLWNWLLNVTLCIALVTLVCSGLILWWKRRPAQWSAPVVAARPWRAVGFFMLTVSLVFPLAAAAIAGVALLDLVILRRVRRTTAPAPQLNQ